MDKESIGQVEECDSDFWWVPVYETLATKLRQYRNQQEKLRTVYADLVGIGNSTEHLSGIVDPFSFFAVINSYGDINRLKALKIVGKFFDSAANFPESGFRGVPKAIPFQRQYDIATSEEDRWCYWDLFEAALDYADSNGANEVNRFVNAYSKVKMLPNNGANAKLSQALFWMRPRCFLPIDLNTESYFAEKYGISIAKSMGGQKYLDLMDLIKSKTSDPFYLLSAKAYELRGQKDAKSMQEKTHMKTRDEALLSVSNTSSIRGGSLCSKNLILYGPPGTGKTYSTAAYAVAMCDGKTVDDVVRSGNAADRYSELRKSGRIGFTTFHQSFSYEDFVEGIKPVIEGETPEDAAQDLRYTIEDGVFKSFCDRARRDASGVSGLNANPKVWKVSLGGTGENSIRTDCLNNGYIRFGYDDVLPDEGGNIPSGVQGRNIVNALYNRMNVGDVVCSCWSATEVDAIGIVTGEEAWHRDGIEFGHYRKVKWLKGKQGRLPIVELNGGKRLVTGSIYELGSINVSDLFEVAGISAEAKHNRKQGDPYVFIIDEINRGNVSAIFGELITLLEDNKRLGEAEEKRTILPYSKQEWGIPSNVYVIATMNTADRSLTQLDTALRRRFDFVELQPDYEVMRGRGDDGVIDGDIDLPRMLEIINRRIEALYDRDHTIGHAYFLNVKSIEQLRDMFANKVIPLLEEYFFEDFERIRMVLNDVDGVFIEREEPNMRTLGLVDFPDDEWNEGDLRPIYRVTEPSLWTADAFRHIYDTVLDE